MAVFKDELLNLFPDDPLARQLSERTMLLAEFLDKVAEFEPPRLDRKALLRGHCHHKAIFGMASDRRLLARAGLEVTTLDDGCCGMAGAFGYEAHKYPVAMAVAEDRTLPAVRDAAPDTLLVCDGYSCREQILQATGRRVFTLPEVLQRALYEGEHADFPAIDRRPEEARRQATALALGISVAMAGGAAWLAARNGQQGRPA
jgi:Fe-S oxidoreductase